MKIDFFLVVFKLCVDDSKKKRSLNNKKTNVICHASAIYRHHILNLHKFEMATKRKFLSFYSIKKNFQLQQIITKQIEYNSMHYTNF